MTTITGTISLSHPTRKPAPAPSGRIPRVARLMALAIRLDGLLREGVVGTQAELAELGGVTRARLTQILNLLSLAPQIQEELLFHPPVKSGKDPITEHQLRRIAAQPCWLGQREAWSTIHSVPL